MAYVEEIVNGCGLLWYAVRVKTREEARVATALRCSGFPVLLPTCIERRRWSDRVKTVTAALFPGYLFCQFEYTRRLFVQSVPSVLGIVTFHPGGTPVHEEEIASLSILMTTSRRSSECQYVQSGTRVKITSGPLRGVTGILERESQRSGRLIISVTLLARSVRVELEDSDVCALESPYLESGYNDGSICEKTLDLA